MSLLLDYTLVYMNLPIHYLPQLIL